MFDPKTDKIKELSVKYHQAIEGMSKVFDETTNVYIDYANVVWWQDKLKWHFNIKRLKQLLDSFDTTNEIKFYYGELVDTGNKKEEINKSKLFLEEIKKTGFILRTKPVKLCKLSIDATGIPFDSPSVIKDFIKKPLIKKFDLDAIEYLNRRLIELNQRGIYAIEDRKCNFDVEIGTDMIIDDYKDGVKNFVLWSGDSDFYDPLKQLLDKGKRVAIFCTSGKISRELNELKKDGLIVFDIKKIKNFMCWNKEKAY